MLLLTESTLDFLNLKSLFSKDVKTTIKECIKNWNDIVVSAMMPNACPPSLPSCWTPLSSYISPIEPPTPSDKANYEECFRMLPSPKAMDDTAVIIKNKGNDLVVSATVPKACPSSFPCHQTPLSSHVSPIEPPTPSDKANYEEHFRMLSSPKAMGPSGGYVWATEQEQFHIWGECTEEKTTVTVIDIDEDPIPTKTVKSEKVVHHQRQTSISSFALSVASEAVPTSSNLELKSSHGSSHFTNNDLPTMFLKDRKWSKNVLPTLLLWLGDQPNIWSVPEGDLIHAS
ncbi:hypothetical protein V8B97DRAFT_2011070 [Scleroderma yunnanense]